MQQLIRSFQHFFSCNITCLNDPPPQREDPDGGGADDGDILPEYLQNSTRVLIARSRLQGVCAVLWEFPGRRDFAPGELEHLLQCSRMIAMKRAEHRREEELYFYKQVTQLLAKKTDEGLILLDREGSPLYQNKSARSRRILDRYQAYIQQFEELRGTDRKEHTVYLEGTVPVQLDIAGLYSGDTFLGRIITTRSKSFGKTSEDRERPRKGDELLYILGKDPVIGKTLRIARRAADTDATVLLSGESGTGKEQFARAIHYMSARRNKPFVAINCAAIPEQLLESELFGYEEGAFTGAARGGKVGKIEAADSGTIFLDEIGDMPLNLQAKLLRVLQRREFERVGGTREISVNVRFISATHRNLRELMKEEVFRGDLFYRLNVVPIHIPALREHRRDVGILLNYYLKKYALMTGRDFSYFTYDAMKILTSYDWPGNIRELENVVQYCLTMSVGGVIGTEDLPPGMVRGGPEFPDEGASEKEEHGKRSFVMQRLSGKRRASPGEVRQLIELFGEDTAGKRKAAEHLGISLATLYRRINGSEN